MLTRYVPQKSYLTNVHSHHADFDDSPMCCLVSSHQKQITELNHCHLKPVFDKQDKDDYFRGIDVRSRVQIPSIAGEINASLGNERFLEIFHYGGEEDIDLAGCGIPNREFRPYAYGKRLRSVYGGFQVLERKEKLSPTIVSKQLS